MPDWKAKHRPEPPPGPTDPPPSPVTPGWSEWLRSHLPAELDQPMGYRLQSVGIRILSAETVCLPVEGEEPKTEWSPDLKVEYGKGTRDYIDFTRYRLEYPSITMQWYLRVELEITAIYACATDGVGRPYPPETKTSKVSFLSPVGQPVTLPNYRVFRWGFTSHYMAGPYGEMGSIVFAGDFDGRRVPWSARGEPRPEDLGPPTDKPPERVIEKVRPQREVNGPKGDEKVGFVVEEDEETAQAVAGHPTGSIPPALTVLHTDGEIAHELAWVSIPPEEVGFALWAEAAELAVDSPA